MTFDLSLNRHAEAAETETLRSGNALEFASTALRAERMVVLTAVRENKGAMAYASKEIWGWEGRVEHVPENEV